MPAEFRRPTSASKPAAPAPAPAPTSASSQRAADPLGEIPQDRRSLIKSLGAEDSVRNLLQEKNENLSAIIMALNEPDTQKALATQWPEGAHQLIEAASAYVSDRDIPGHIDLANCTPQSFVTALKQLAAIQLVPDYYAGTAFLVARKGIVAPTPGVRGWEAKLGKAFPLGDIYSEVVREQDEFVPMLGTDMKLRHIPNMKPDRNAPNNIIASYTIITDGSGRTHVELVPISTTESERLNAGKVVTDPVTKKPFKDVAYKAEDRVVNTKRCDAAVACRYVSRRRAMRAVARTWGHGNEVLSAMMKLENAAADYGESESVGEERVAKVKTVSVGGPKRTATRQSEAPVEISEDHTTEQEAPKTSARI